MFFITAGVGVGQPNRPRDVGMVQRLLNMSIGLLNRRSFNLLHPLSVNGHYDRETHALLRAWCRSIGESTAQPAAKFNTPAEPPAKVPSAAALAEAEEAYWLAKVGFDLPTSLTAATTATVADMKSQPGPEFASANTVLRSLVLGPLAWQGEFPVGPGDPVVSLLESGRLGRWPVYKALSRMRSSRSLLAVLTTMAPTIRRNKHASPEAIAESVQLAMRLADISTPLREAAFLAQLAAESDGFQAVREYASGKAYEGRADLGNVLPGDGVRFAGRGYIQITGRSNYSLAWHDLKLPMVHNAALKPFASGPHAKFKTDLEPEDPTHGETLEGAAQVTAWYWNHHKLNAICDRLTKVGDQDAVLLRLSIAINGKNKTTGLPNGWEGRKRYFKAAKHALGIH